jgi:hypothetical protein
MFFFAIEIKPSLKFFEILLIFMRISAAPHHPPFHGRPELKNIV